MCSYFNSDTLQHIPTFKKINFCIITSYSYLLVESMMTPNALSLSVAVIAGPSDAGTIKNILNNSSLSTILSMSTGTLTLVLVIPLANVAVSEVVLKSRYEAVSQIFFSQHIANNTHITSLPLANTDECSDGVTVTVNGLVDTPPLSSSSTSTYLIFSDPVNW